MHLFWQTLINIFTSFAVALAALCLCFWAVRMLDRWLFPGLSFQKALREGNLALAIFLAAVILGLFSLVGRAVAAPTDRYDGDFHKWGRRYFSYTVDWRVFKAQGLTESGLNPALCSRAGACGLMQFLPGTALAMGLHNRFDARASIAAGIRYDRQLWEQWSAPRPPRDRLQLTLVAYNAGLGNALRWQRQAAGDGVADPNRYGALRPYLWPEPRRYVEMTGRWCRRLGASGCW